MSEPTINPESVDRLLGPPRGERLNLEAKLRQESLRATVEQVRDGRRPAAPVVVEFDLTTHCDLGCPECISTALLRTTRFEGGRLLELVDEMAASGVRAVIMIGGGEPLVHPQASDFIIRASDAGIKVGLTTNGTQIHRHLAAVSDRVSWTRVSVDAGTSTTYARFRPARGGRGSMFDTVIRNMRTLAHRKTGSLGYSYLLIARRDATGDLVEHNYDEVAAAARIAREIGCDFFEVKPEYDMEHHLREQPEALRALVEDRIAAAQAEETSQFKVIAPAHLATVLAASSLNEPKEYTSCPTTHLRTLVTPSGVYACPYHRGRDHARLGDVRRESFDSVWRSAADGPPAIDPSKSCGFNCIRHETNLRLLDPAPLPASVPDYDPFI